MSVYKRGDNNKWAISVVFKHADGRVQRVRRTSPVNTKEGAKEYERQVREALLRNPDTFEKPTGGALPLSKFLKEYFGYLKPRVRPSSYDTAVSQVSCHVLPLFGDTPVRDIGRREIDRLTTSLLEKGLMESSVNSVLRRFHAALAVAQEWGYLSVTPRFALLREAQRSPDFLTFEEADVLLDRSRRFRVAFALALKAGLRIGEIQGLQWSDIDFKRKVLSVRRSRDDSRIGPPKSGRERVVDMPDSLIKELQYCIRHVGVPWVVCNEDGQPAGRSTLVRELNRVLGIAGISRTSGVIGWHDLRHTYASHLVQRGVPLKVIQELLGHASMNQTLVYAHLSPETKRTAVSVLDVTSGSPRVFGIR